MCIGIPMQVMQPDGRFAWCEGRGERRRVHTALIGDTAPGEHLLVFLDDARERIDAGRAAEINAALDLVIGAMHGSAPVADVDFVLPSRMSTGQMQALTNATVEKTR